MQVHTDGQIGVLNITARFLSEYFRQKLAMAENCTIFASRFRKHPIFVHNLFKINEITHEKG